MYWVIGAVAVAGVVAWLNSEEQAACTNYHASSRRLSTETSQRQQQIAERRANYEKNQNFYEHIELHHASHLTADALYKELESHKKIVAMLREKQQSFGQCIGELKQQRDAAKSDQKQFIKEQLKQMREQLNEAKEYLVMLSEEKEHKLTQIRQINNATREYKLYIRDYCGEKGRDWYERSAERARLRAS
ncbi:chromosome segregation ATPase [Psychrobacter luti]|uniref:Chromosome segregation ATPase n=1 Tax=Psychrobacter luti TaxID=198481 RepID=A0A839TCH3_9GAMM|nr:hypothetical protein [Psychrobacter luti]MBB3106126.1 chromosome segregation ATPase [Psychrobacter luti]